MLALRSTPICLMMSRRTSATATFNMTWSRPRTTMELIDLVGTADQPRGDVAGLLGLDRACRRSGQQHAFADAFDVDSGQSFAAAPRERR